MKSLLPTLSPNQTSVEFTNSSNERNAMTLTRMNEMIFAERIAPLQAASITLSSFLEKRNKHINIHDQNIAK